MLCYVMLWYALLCYAMLCYAMLCYAMLCYALLCYAMLRYPMLCYAMLCYAMIILVSYHLKVFSFKKLLGLICLCLFQWMTVCLNMEKSLLSDAFVYVYALMSRQTQDPSLPIIGDVVRRISLCSPPKKKTDPGRIDRIMMLGEVERLDTFKTWPHKNYE